MTFGLSWFFLGHLDLPFLVGSLQPPNNRSLPQRSRLFSFCGLVAFLAGAHCCCHIEIQALRVRPGLERSLGVGTIPRSRVLVALDIRQGLGDQGEEMVNGARTH